MGSFNLLPNKRLLLSYQLKSRFELPPLQFYNQIINTFNTGKLYIFNEKNNTKIIYFEQRKH